MVIPRIALATIVLFGSAIASYAQGPSPAVLTTPTMAESMAADGQKATPAPGAFVPFGAWERLRYGATSLTDPKTAKAADFAYVYSPSAFSPEQWSSWLTGADASAKQPVWLASQTDSGAFVALSPEQTKQAIDQWKSAGGAADFWIMSADKLSGQGGKPAIAWPSYSKDSLPR